MTTMLSMFQKIKNKKVLPEPISRHFEKLCVVALFYFLFPKYIKDIVFMIGNQDTEFVSVYMLCILKKFPLIFLFLPLNSFPFVGTHIGTFIPEH